ncbi:MAG: HPF/RaiA family ribosome-associated protein [Rhodococcus sp. (in: high G+C Gram-positive bacteria)]|uniref:ribosome hibernation promotion factor n=1 Tax=Rhodococcus sp. TaxID=1831 RepID=UPI003BB032CD
MSHPSEPETTFDIDVTTHGHHPGAEDYVRYKIGGLGRLAHEPILSARVKVSKHPDPAVERPVVAQANLDVNGRPVRAQVEATNTREAVDRLEARLRHRLERIAEHWESRRGKMPSSEPHEWRHTSEPAHRPDYFPRQEEEREIVRHKSFALSNSTVDEAAFDMDLLDYDFHLFNEVGTGEDSVLYRDESGGYRLAQLTPPEPSQLGTHQLELTVSSQPAPRLTTEEAVQRLNLLGTPFLFFADADTGRGRLLYRRYDGHYGLITPA